MLAELGESIADQYEEPISNFNCTLILAIENLLCTQVTLPGKQAKHFKQALPFLVEEKLTVDIESMHLSTGPRIGDNSYNVVAIEREKLQQLLAFLKDSEIEPDVALGDAQLLQPAELFVGDSRALLSLNSGEIIAVESDNVELLLNSAFNSNGALESTEIPSLTVNYESELSGEMELQLQALDSAQSAQVNISAAPIEFTTVLLDRIADCRFINLLQGTFTARKKHAQNQVKWQIFALAAVVLLALQLSYFIASGFYFNNQAEVFATDTEKLYRQYFPEDRRIIDIKRQAQAHFRGANSEGNSNFVALLGAFANSWKNNAHNTIKIEQIRYNAKRSQMTIEVQAKSIDQLDSLQREITKKGIKAELMSANESDTGVLGRLQLGT
jgi:general secretion pathway protein L|tara:strand:- start:1624 stop:2778 length:1155 start_codon:yes stop_codon:yes gene_type:complete